MERMHVGKGWVGRFCTVALIIVLLVVLEGAASACCCTCENSSRCFPICTEGLIDRATCDTACMESGCGHIAACPDPSSGANCAAGEVSCLDLGPVTSAPAPALAPGGLLVAALLLAGAGYLTLLKRRHH